MKAIVIVGFLFVWCTQVQSERDPYAAYSGYERECLEELKLDVEAINKAFGRASEIKEGDEEVNKFIECAGRKDGTITADGKINFDALAGGIRNTARKMLEYPPSEVERFYNKVEGDCKNINGTSPGDLKIKVHNCINDHFLYG